MKWELVNIKPERLNGLKLRVAQTTPETTVPKLLDHLLEEAGIGLLTEQELRRGIKRSGVGRLMTALENTTSDTYSNEDEVTKRHLKFLMYLIEAATKDPEWSGQLKGFVERFGEVEQ